MVLVELAYGESDVHETAVARDDFGRVREAHLFRDAAEAHDAHRHIDRSRFDPNDFSRNAQTHGTPHDRSLHKARPSGDAIQMLQVSRPGEDLSQGDPPIVRGHLAVEEPVSYTH